MPVKRNVKPTVEPVSNSPVCQTPTATPATTSASAQPTASEINTEACTLDIPTTLTLREKIDALNQKIKDGKKMLTSKTTTIENFKEYNSNLLTELEDIKSTSHKELRKKRNVPRNRTQSGIERPVSVKPSICDFAGWERGSLHSRVEISRVLNQYIEKHNLQNPAARREILPDKTLAALLEYDPVTDGQIYYTSIQKLISRLIE